MPICCRQLPEDAHVIRRRLQLRKLSDGCADVVCVRDFWFWLAISVFSDLFRRGDISGWGKALWVIGVVLFPYIGVLAYMISQGKGMAERSVARVQQAREELRNVIGFSVADEIEKLDRLKCGSITEGEFTHLRAKLVKAA
jgi:Phospholipase_D-nuclease N-terminal